MAKKKIISIVAIISAVAVFIGVTFAINFASAASTRTATEPPIIQGGFTIDSSSTPQGAKLTSVALSANDYEVYNISDDAESAQKLTVSLTPDLDTTFSWSCSWVDGNSDWASGKDVNDYVRFTHIDNTEKTVVLECLKGFGERISVTATSDIVQTDDGPRRLILKSFCDYIKRIVDFKAVNRPGTKDEFLFDSSTDVFEIDLTTDSLDNILLVQAVPVYSDYTIDFARYSASISCSYRLNPKLIPLFEEALYEATGKQLKFDETYSRGAHLQFTQTNGWQYLSGLSPAFFNGFMAEGSASYLYVDKNTILQVLADNPDEPFIYFDVKGSSESHTAPLWQAIDDISCVVDYDLFTVGMRYTAESISAALGGV